MILQVLVYKHLFFISAIAVVFYFLVPGIGAFAVRHQWRNFRKRMISSVSSPLLNYARLHTEAPIPGETYRFFGSLQALQGESELWLSGNNLSVSVDMSRVSLYILPSAPHLSSPIGEAGYPDETPRKIKWDRIFSLSEGTRMFVFGSIIRKNGKTCFVETPDAKLFVVIYDCSDEAFFSQAIWTGRQRNEYWNPATPGSLTVGSFSLFIYFYILLQKSYMQFPAGIALLLSLVPLLLFSPPGLGFYYVYRYLWKKARMLRAQRDLVKLPLSFFAEESLYESVSRVSLSLSEAQYEMKKCGAGEMERYSTDFTVRKTSFLEDDFYLFQVKNSDGEVIRRSPDPMAENILIPGNPLTLAEKSEKKAFKLEILSSTAILADFLVNGVLFFVGITYLLR